MIDSEHVNPAAPDGQALSQIPVWRKPAETVSFSA